MKLTRAMTGIVAVSILAATQIGGCGGGGGSGGGGSTSNAAYEAQIASFKETYGKSDEWEAWMLANQARYVATFAASSTRPNTITVSFHYETAQIDYDPSWVDEDEHMDQLTTIAEGAYSNYDFNIVFAGDTGTSYANIVAGTAGTTSYASGNTVYLYYETIFNHEFGHVMKLPHHYDTAGQIGDGLHMPPGETKCIMDRNSSVFCSACRTALGIPLGAIDIIAMDAAANDIISRYPY